MFDLPVVLVSYNDEMTCLKVKRLLFIYIPYLKTTPVDFVTFCL